MKVKLTKKLKEDINKLLIKLEAAGVPDAQKLEGINSVYGEAQRAKYKKYGFLDKDGEWEMDVVNLSFLKHALKAAVGDVADFAREFMEGSPFLSNDEAAATGENGEEIPYE